MKNINITQELISKYVATTEYFWREFHKSLSAPYSFWNEYKDKSVKEWINLCQNTEGMIPYLNLLFQFPILKGEYLIVYSSGMVLTNYRLILNDENAGVPNIPLCNILEYNDSGKIKYKKNNQTIELEYREFLDNKIVNSTKSRNESNNLTQEQLFILENSLYELKNHNSELRIPQVEIPPIVEEELIMENQRTGSDEKNRFSKTKDKFSKIKDKFNSSNLIAKLALINWGIIAFGIAAIVSLSGGFGIYALLGIILGVLTFFICPCIGLGIAGAYAGIWTILVMINIYIGIIALGIVAILSPIGLILSLMKRGENPKKVIYFFIAQLLISWLGLYFLYPAIELVA